MHIQIPADFSAFLITRYGADAETWLSSVPEIVGHKLADWGLVLEDAIPLHGATGLVFLVCRGNERLVMKVGWRDELTESENKALKLWDGNGAVRLLDYDVADHVSLMERLRRNSLAEIELAQAGVEAGKLVRQLGLECESGFPMLIDRAGQMRVALAQHGHDAADIDLQVIDKLLIRRTPAIDSYLSHGDLGYLNVLRSYEGEWKAIDPKPMIGDLEFSIPELMWTRIDELSDDQILNHLERIVDAGRLDRQKAIDWTVIRAVDYYFWGLNNGLTEDPERCLRLHRALIDKV